MQTNNKLEFPPKRSPYSREEWLEWRKDGLGATDIGAVMGLSPWMGPYELWIDKTGRGGLFNETERMRWGLLLEPAIAGRWADLLQINVHKADGVVHPEKSWVRATPDYWTVPGPGEPPMGILECKTASRFMKKHWGESGTVATTLNMCVPEHYFAQVQWQLFASGLHRGDIAVLFDDLDDFRHFGVARDGDYIKKMEAEGEKFWRRVLTDNAPEPGAGAGCRKALNEQHPRVKVEASAALPKRAQRHIDNYKKACETIKKAEKKKSLSQNALMKMLGDHRMGQVGRWVVGWTDVKGREAFDKAQFEKDHPKLFEQYKCWGASVRRFLAPREGKDDSNDNPTGGAK